MTTSLALTGCRREDFFGKAVEFREASDSSLWLTAEQAAVPLGLGSARAVRKLFADNKADFLEGQDFATVTLAVPYSGNQKFREQSMLVFSLSGLDALALLTRNEVGRRARRWTVVLRENIRRAGPNLVAELERVRAQLEETRRTYVAHLEDLTVRSFELTKEQSSTIAWLLGRRGVQKRLERRLLNELKSGQTLFPPPKPPEGLSEDEARKLTGGD